MTGTLPRHAVPRDLMKLSMNERNQWLESGLVAVPPPLKQRGDLRGMVRNGAILRPFAPSKSVGPHAFIPLLQVLPLISRFLE